MLLARVLLGIAVRFEQRSPLSLAVCANLLRVLDSDGVLVKDLPVLTGVSKEGLAMAMHPLTKRDLAVVGPAAGGSRFKAIRLTNRGQEAQWAYTDWTGRLDNRARPAPRRRRRRGVAGGPGAAGGRPGRPGPQPAHGRTGAYPDNWRADAPPPQTLPHFPMVLHRGGFPDGS